MNWIKVEDRLPTKNDEQIVCLINGNPVLCCVHDNAISLVTGRVSFYWPTSTWDKDPYYAEITHWMSLPSPPKEKEQSPNIEWKPLC
jgi:hypothetical protein